jgi:hypothetical protein
MNTADTLALIGLFVGLMGSWATFLALGLAIGLVL